MTQPVVLLLRVLPIAHQLLDWLSARCIPDKDVGPVTGGNQRRIGTEGHHKAITLGGTDCPDLLPRRQVPDPYQTVLAEHSHHRCIATKVGVAKLPRTHRLLARLFAAGRIPDQYFSSLVDRGQSLAPPAEGHGHGGAPVANQLSPRPQLFLVNELLGDLGVDPPWYLPQAHDPVLGTGSEQRSIGAERKVTELADDRYPEGEAQQIDDAVEQTHYCCDGNQYPDHLHSPWHRTAFGCVRIVHNTLSWLAGPNPQRLGYGLASV